MSRNRDSQAEAGLLLLLWSAAGMALIWFLEGAGLCLGLRETAGDVVSNRMEACPVVDITAVPSGTEKRCDSLGSNAEWLPLQCIRW